MTVDSACLPAHISINWHGLISVYGFISVMTSFRRALSGAPTFFTSSQFIWRLKKIHKKTPKTGIMAFYRGQLKGLLLVWTLGGCIGQFWLLGGYNPPPSKIYTHGSAVLDLTGNLSYCTAVSFVYTSMESFTLRKFLLYIYVLLVMWCKLLTLPHYSSSLIYYSLIMPRLPPNCIR